MKHNSRPILLAIAVVSFAFGTRALAQDQTSSNAVLNSAGPSLVAIRVTTIHPLRGKEEAAVTTAREGAGVILTVRGLEDMHCSESRKDCEELKILTVRHLVLPSEKRGPPRFGTRLLDRRIELVFPGGDPVKWRVEQVDEHVFSFDTELDLAIITLDVPTKWNREAVTVQKAFAEETYSIGNYWGDRQWDVLAGKAVVRRLGQAPNECIKGKRWLIEHDTPGYREGFSGGPLLNRQGELLGLNVQLCKTPERGNAISATVLLERVFEQVRLDLVLTAGNDETLGHRNFRAGLLYANRTKWKQTEQRMLAAIRNLNEEGSVVRLRGMRYAEYTPSYYLALAKERLAQKLHEPSLPGTEVSDAFCLLTREATAQIEDSSEELRISKKIGKLRNRLEEAKSACDGRAHKEETNDNPE